MERGGTTYMMTSPNHVALYTGVTSDLKNRVYEHKTKKYPESFTAKYNCIILVFYKSFPTIEEAIAFEKKLKATNRIRKEKFVNEMNPNWRDLWDDIKEW